MMHDGVNLSPAAYRNESGIWIDPNDAAYDDASVGGEPVGPEGAPIVYLFCNHPSGDGVCYAMAEDGHVLGSHWCSAPGYMKHDLHDRASRKEAILEHYPDGYRLQVLARGDVPPMAVYDRNQQLKSKADEK